MEREYTNEDYQNGITKEEIQYGVKYPDGHMEWYDWSGDFSTLSGQLAFKRDYAERLKLIGAPAAIADELVFLMRKKTISYSETVTFRALS